MRANSQFRSVVVLPMTRMPPKNKSKSRSRSTVKCPRFQFIRSSTNGPTEGETLTTTCPAGKLFVVANAFEDCSFDSLLRMATAFLLPATFPAGAHPTAHHSLISHNLFPLTRPGRISRYTHIPLAFLCFRHRLHYGP